MVVLMTAAPCLDTDLHNGYEKKTCITLNNHPKDNANEQIHVENYVIMNKCILIFKPDYIWSYTIMAAVFCGNGQEMNGDEAVIKIEFKLVTKNNCLDALVRLVMTMDEIWKREVLFSPDSRRP